MDRRLIRILLYMVLGSACLAVATFFTDSQAAFVAIFAVGLVIGLMADLMFLARLFRLPWHRRGQ